MSSDAGRDRTIDASARRTHAAAPAPPPENLVGPGTLPGSSAAGPTWRLAALLGLGMFFELYDLLFTGYVAPGLVKAGILSPAPNGVLGLGGTAGFVASLFAGLFVGTLACGWLADRFGRRRMFTWSLLAYTVANAAMAFQTAAASLDSFRFLAGVGLGLEMVTIDAYLAEVVPAPLRGRAFALVQAIGFCAVPVAAALSYLLVPRAPLGVAGWRWVVLAGCSAACFVVLLRRGLPESPRWLLEKGRTEEAEGTLGRLGSGAASEVRALLPAIRVPREPPRFRDLLGPIHRRHLLAMSGFNLLQTIGYHGFAVWAPTLLVAEGLTVTRSLAYTALIAIAAPFGPVLGLAFGDRLERKWIVFAACLAFVACGLAFAQARQAPVIVAMGVGLTLSSNVLSFSFHAYQSEMFPTAVRARAVGFVYSWSRLAAVLAAFAISDVLGLGGTSAVFAMICAAMLGAGLLVLLFGPRTSEVRLEAIRG